MRFVVSLAALTLLSSVVFTPRVVTSSLRETDSIAPAARAYHGSDDGLDLYVAVATYSLDPTGSLYERHSPQTELPRLASPKS